MIDLHTHILPGLDDGSQDMDTSIEMVKIAIDNGTTAIVATPHAIEGEWLPTWEQILETCTALKVKAREQGLDIPIYPGAEVAIHMDILDKVKAPGPYCINGGRYMLVELPAMEIPDFVEDFFFALETRGITPILAHPERNPIIMKDPELLLEWVKRGILLQINAPSLTGRMGEKAKRTAELLLASNLMYFIGSDAHGIHSRRPRLNEARHCLEKTLSAQEVQRIFMGNPTAAIQGHDIEIIEVEHIKPQNTGIRRWFSKFF